MSQPNRVLIWMLGVLVLIGLAAVALYPQLRGAFEATRAFNAVILAVFAVGVVVNLLQVLRLQKEVRWIENLAGDEKRKLLAHARAMLFPLEWEEPFGLAMVEAMASGTPVIAFPRGAARQLVEPGVTGFLAESAEEMVALLARVAEAACFRRPTA